MRGAVQGVGFRPFVYRLATELGLTGWVNNSTQGVFIEVEGPQVALEQLLLRLEAEKPPRSFIQSLEASWLDATGYSDFVIRESEAGGVKTALVLPDVATCPDCLREVFDPANRRYFYPFTNCTHCGPRFSIIESLPYDRPNTAMKRFAMCPPCQAEYDDPRDRRFHAQPNACPECGPQVELWDGQGKPVASGANSPGGSQAVVAAAADAIRQGRIVAVKGLGGFHLMVAAEDDQAVRRLRALKHREEKPLGLMFPSLAAIKAICEVAPFEDRLLRSPEAPIVLLRRIHASGITHHASAALPSVAPGNPNLGVMLPYTPLHHLLMSLLGAPVVATSGNLSDEPICTNEHEALERLGGIADLFLVHNRPIVRHVDDSIVRMMMGRELVLRRARGYAPLPVTLSSAVANGVAGAGKVILAVGAQLKNTIALSVGSQVFISQHIGDLETDLAYEAFRRVIADFTRLYDVSPAVIAADAHPDYLSTRFAQDLVSRGSRREGVLPNTGARLSPAAAHPDLSCGPMDIRPFRTVVAAAAGDSRAPKPTSALGQHAREEAQTSAPQPSIHNPQLLLVQHHMAHVLSCMAENELQPPLLGVSWDGTGYGLDHTVWGGEFFLITATGCQRVAHLRQFPLPGGDQAVKEPRRTALGLLYEMFGDEAFGMRTLAPLRAFSPAELAPLKTMLARKLNSPLTSSAGRLFDAVAALAGLRQHVRFEGQAAMELEFALEDAQPTDAYQFLHAPRNTHPASATEPSPLILDWCSVIREILADLDRKVPVSEISARFHNALAEAVVAVARQACQIRVVLSGGCFQNRYLTERAVRRLREEGFQPYWHQRVPPNDGGISLGQAVAALRESGAA